MGFVRGDADPLTDVLVSSQSTAQRVAALQQARQRMSPREFEDWWRDAVDERESFGIDDTMRAADIVNCRCGGEGCDLPMPSVESVVRWQAESDPDEAS